MEFQNAIRQSPAHILADRLRAVRSLRQQFSKLTPLSFGELNTFAERCLTTARSEIPGAENYRVTWVCTDKNMFEEYMRDVSSWEMVERGAFQTKVSRKGLIKNSKALLNSFFYQEGEFFLPETYYKIIGQRTETIELIETSISLAIENGKEEIASSLANLEAPDIQKYQNIVNTGFSFSPECFSDCEVTAQDPFEIEGLTLEDKSRILPGDLVMYFGLDDKGGLMTQVLRLELNLVKKNRN